MLRMRGRSSVKLLMGRPGLCLSPRLGWDACSGGRVLLLVGRGSVAPEVEVGLKCRQSLSQDKRPFRVICIINNQ